MTNTERIVEKLIKVCETNDLTELITWLEKLGCKEITKDKDSATLTRLTGMRVGFLMSDPVTLAVCTGFALFGLHWVSLCPGLLEKVNKLWKAGQLKTMRFSLTEEQLKFPF